MQEEFKNIEEIDSPWYSKFKTGIRTPMGHPLILCQNHQSETILSSALAP